MYICMYVQGSTENQFTEWTPCRNITVTITITITIFVNAPPLPLLCEISGVLHLAQPGLTAGWLAGCQTKYR